MTAAAADVARTRAIASFLTRHEVRVVWFDGWESRGVDLPFGPPRAHVCHWDASTILSGQWGAIGIILNGRGGAAPVPPPLAQYQGARCLDGVPTVGICAAGRCNQAGTGGPYRLGDGTIIPADSMNRWGTGSEWAWAGPSETPTAAALHAYDVLAAAHLEVLEIPTLNVISHEEWTEGNPYVRPPRKSDIGDTIHRVRRNAAAILTGQQLEDDMPTIQELNEAAAAGQLAPFFDAGAKRTMTVIRDLGGGATAAQISSAVIQLAGRISDTRSAVLEFLGTQPTDGLSEDERRQLVADIVAGLDALSEDDADAVAEKLAERPLVFGPAPAA